MIKQMTADLNYPIEIVVVPTMREHGGLAMSSRNRNLSEDECRAADVIFRALQKAKEAFTEGERSAEKIRKIMTDEINSEPLAEIDYVSCANVDTLLELGEIEDQALCSIAVIMGETRLIDNIIFTSELGNDSHV